MSRGAGTDSDTRGKQRPLGTVKSEVGSFLLGTESQAYGVSGIPKHPWGFPLSSPGTHSELFTLSINN